VAVNIRDLAIIQRARAALAELIDACRPRGGQHGHDASLTNDVIRKAKGLETSLGKLQEAAENLEHRPGEEKVMPKESLVLRLHYVFTGRKVQRLTGRKVQRSGFTIAALREADQSEKTAMMPRLCPNCDVGWSADHSPDQIPIKLLYLPLLPRGQRPTAAAPL
jgi:hypothetical protein